MWFLGLKGLTQEQLLSKDVCLTEACLDRMKNGMIRPFPSSPGPLFQNEGRCSVFDVEIIFHSHANKTHFHKKGCTPSSF